MTTTRPSSRIDAELHVRAAGVDADLAQHGDRRVAQALVFLVGQRLRRRDRDRVAGVHAHRIEVLDRADDDAVVRLVADDFHLELFPAEHRFLDQHFVHRRQFEAALDDFFEFFDVVGDAATGAAEREARSDDRRIADLGLDLERLLERFRDFGFRTVEADVDHRAAEQLAILGHADRIARRTDQLDAVFFEHAVIGEIERAVERGLAAHRRQQRVGPFLGDDLFDGLPVDRLDVDRVGRVRVGHDRRRIRIDQDDAVAFLLERLARLRAGIVELAGLTDDDRAGADDQDRAEISSFWHRSFLRPCRAPPAAAAR